ncbi:hypothetical protein D9758_014750 [Tetrapyrgos nigripes]|uniref:BTB domain-containing protein n=1 Tax=Tetrapyrgos nigripes TaxID=182062 RepID=A0A8H5CIL4_9AGAR|nr:hypothetical protein D9758_014750 [Tetrapyrgos nigripes]
MNVVCEANERCQLPVDIVFESSDGRKLGCHTTLLTTHTDAFPLQGLIPPQPGELVKMDESGEVLLLLFKFLHNQPDPDVKEVRTGVLSELLRAADKWGVYRAPVPIFEAVKLRATVNPVIALKWSSEHGRPTEDIDEIAKKLLDINDRATPEELKTHPDLLVAWYLYSRAWDDRSFELAQHLRDTLEDIPFAELVDYEYYDITNEEPEDPPPCKWQYRKHLIDAVRDLPRRPSTDDLEKIDQTLSRSPRFIVPRSVKNGWRTEKIATSNMVLPCPYKHIRWQAGLRAQISGTRDIQNHAGQITYGSSIKLRCIHIFR